MPKGPKKGKSVQMPHPKQMPMQPHPVKMPHQPGMPGKKS